MVVEKSAIIKYDKNVSLFEFSADELEAMDSSTEQIRDHLATCESTNTKAVSRDDLKTLAQPVGNEVWLAAR